MGVSEAQGGVVWQWHARPCQLTPGPSLGAELPVNIGEFSCSEVRQAVEKLRTRRATGPEEIPAEYWQSIVQTTEGLEWLTYLCNRCWTDELVPPEWRSANVTSIHKKGSTEDCDNYRPVS